MIHVWEDLSKIPNVFYKESMQSIKNSKFAIKNDRNDLTTDDIHASSLHPEM